MNDAEIPHKLYYKIGEVAKITGVKAYVLRYWESEFRLIRPAKSRAGQRLYQRRDIDVLLQIRRLLYDEKYTIPGAKKQLRMMRGPEGKQQLALEFVDGGEGEGLEGDHAAGAEEGDVCDHEEDDGAEPAGLSMDRGLLAEAAPPLVLHDPTSTALIDQAMREANAILGLVEGDAAVR